MNDADLQAFTDTTVLPPKSLYVSPAPYSVLQQSPYPTPLKMQIIQTVPDAQSTLKDPYTAQSTLRFPPVTLQATKSAQLPAHTAQLAIQHPSRPISVLLSTFNPIQTTVTHIATSHTDSDLIPPTAPHQRVTAAPSMPICPQPLADAPVPQTGYLPQPGTELLMATAYSIPRPTLPVF